MVDPPRAPTGIWRHFRRTGIAANRAQEARSHAPHQEDDRVEILAACPSIGVNPGETPIAMLCGNKDQRPGDYSDTWRAFRPSLPMPRNQTKYGIQARSGGGTVLSARNDRRGGRPGDRQANCSPTPHMAAKVIAWVKRIHTMKAAIDPTTW